MGEFRSLGLVHRHRVHGLHRLQPAGQHPVDAVAAIARRKGHAQDGACRGGVGATAPRHLQRDADVAVHQTQRVVIARHHHWPALVPALGGACQPFGAQQVGDALIEPLHTMGAVTHCAQHLELAVGEQHLARPGVPGFGVRIGRRTARPQPLQVESVAHRRPHGFAVIDAPLTLPRKRAAGAIQGQTRQGLAVSRQVQPGQIGWHHVPHRAQA